MSTQPDRMIVGISGASGIQYAVKILEYLRECHVESHLVVTKAGQMTRSAETDLSAGDLADLADVTYKISDVGAAIASGSFHTHGMIVAPCSMRSLAEIATGNTTNLLTRAAEVTLKERRRLVLLARETPLTLTHLRNMVAVTENGGIVAPPVPALYTRPESVADLVAHTAARVLDLFELSVPTPRWSGMPQGVPGSAPPRPGAAIAVA
jgi:4-hydroxy-3-polyprenylbenzoate decarboxylase